MSYRDPVRSKPVVFILLFVETELKVQRLTWGEAPFNRVHLAESRSGPKQVLLAQRVVRCVDNLNPCALDRRRAFGAGTKDQRA